MGYTCMYQQGCAPVRANAKLVNITPITLGFMVDISSYLTGVVNQQNITGGLTAPGEIWM